jgi:hypothetical protein
MKFETVLEESFKRYNIIYTGTRKDYKIHDKAPHIIAIDQKYDVDGHGESILGINLNYYDGDVKKLLKAINKADDKHGYRAFDMKVKVKELTSRDEKKFQEWLKNKKIDRYEKLINEFPALGKFIRRYKINGITSKKREIFGVDDREPEEPEN